MRAQQRAIRACVRACVRAQRAGQGFRGCLWSVTVELIGDLMVSSERWQSTVVPVAPEAAVRPY